MICKNCGNAFEGKYCNQCGQKYTGGRFTLKDILHNFFHHFTHLDTGIFFLAKELYVKPGIVAKEYIEGKRNKYYNPFQYLIIIVAISMFITINFNLLGPSPDPSQLVSPDSGIRFSANMKSFFYKYFNLVLFLSVPVSALFSWLFFRKSGYNYSENLVFNAFIAAQRTLTFILLSPFLYVSKKFWYIGIGFYYIFWLIYFIYAFLQFFGEKKLITIVKFLIMYCLLIAVVQASAMVIVYFFYF